MRCLPSCFELVALVPWQIWAIVLGSVAVVTVVVYFLAYVI